MRRRTLLGSGAAALVLGGFGAAASCVGGSGSGEDFRVDVMQSWATTIIMAGFTDLATHCSELFARATSFCAAPDAAGLNATREQWQAARAIFKQLEVLKFGPYSAYPERLGPKIDFWPARPDNIEDVLADDAPLSPEGMEGYGATARGLPVCEYLLYEAGDGSLDAFVNDARRCAYLTAVAGDLEWLATSLHDAWDPASGAFLLQLTEPSSSGMYMDIQQSMSEMVNRMWFTVENIRRDKLGRPLGNETNGSPQPDKVESLFSQRSLDDIRDNLLTIELLFEGTPDGIGLIDHPRVQSYPDLVPSFRDSLQASRDALDAIDAPLDEAVLSEGADAVQTAIDRLADLQRAIQVDLIAALSLDIAFNDSDGD